MTLSRTIRLAGAAGLALGATLGATATSATAAHVDDTVVVTENGDGGILLNRDASTSTPFQFTTDEFSIGDGSLHVLPIGGENRLDKFIAEVGGLDFFTDGTPLAEIDWFESFSYDFLIAGDGDESDAEEFYANVYVNGPGSDDGYADCVYDYAPGAGSTEEFTTFTFDGDTEPNRVRNRTGAFDCGTTLADLEGGQINFVGVNLGDTSLNDEGLAGYFDNIVVDSEGSATAYDLEKAPGSKQECKDGNTAGFKNQGECVSSFAKESSNGKKG